MVVTLDGKLCPNYTQRDCETDDEQDYGDKSSRYQKQRPIGPKRTHACSDLSLPSFPTIGIRNCNSLYESIQLSHAVAVKTTTKNVNVSVNKYFSSSYHALHLKDERPGSGSRHWQCIWSADPRGLAEYDLTIGITVSQADRSRLAQVSE